MLIPESEVSVTHEDEAILVSATGLPVSGQPAKPTFVCGGPLAPGRVHVLDLTVEVKKTELRVGVVSRRYELLQLSQPGQSFYSDSCIDCTAYLLMWQTSSAIQEGGARRQSLPHVSVSRGDTVQAQLDMTVSPPVLRFSHNGAAIGSEHTLPPAWSASDSLHFAVQFFDTADAVRIKSSLRERFASLEAANAALRTDLLAQQRLLRGLGPAAAPPPPPPLPPQPAMLRIAHFSDTHSLHRSIEPSFQLPPADILIHTGDFTDGGSEGAIQDFDEWLGELRARGLYRYVVVIGGNHEFSPMGLKCEGVAHHAPEEEVDPSFLKSRLRHATHVLHHESATIEGLAIFGSSWVPWHSGRRPGGLAPDWAHAQALYRAEAARVGVNPPVHRFDAIPSGVDVLLTHGPPPGILDNVACTGSPRSWGASPELAAAIARAKPVAHLFGHLHEQRGQWVRQADGSFRGGVEYRPQRAAAHTFPTAGPPPPGYPCQFISNNAMKNHPAIERQPDSIAGPPRLITATRGPCGWSFDAAPACG